MNLNRRGAVLGCVVNRRAVTQASGNAAGRPARCLPSGLLRNTPDSALLDLANGTTIGFGSRLVSGVFGNNVIRSLIENTP
jgi:hypothetical protein